MLNKIISKAVSILSDAHTWALVFIFVFNGFSAISGHFNPDTVMTVNGVLVIVAKLLNINPAPNA